MQILGKCHEEIDAQVTKHPLNAETKIVISWTRWMPYIPLSFKWEIDELIWSSALCTVIIGSQSTVWKSHTDDRVTTNLFLRIEVGTNIFYVAITYRTQQTKKAEKIWLNVMKIWYKVKYYIRKIQM